VEQALRILENQHCLNPDFAMAETFAQLADKYPSHAVRIVHVCSMTTGDGWSIHSWNEHLDTILKAALEDGDEAKKEAVTMITYWQLAGFEGTARC